MIRRPPRSTLSSSSAASDVYKRQVLRTDLKTRYNWKRRVRVCSQDDENPVKAWCVCACVCLQHRSREPTWHSSTFGTTDCLFVDMPLVSRSPYSALIPVSYTHLRAHETPEHLVCRLLLEKKKKKKRNQNKVKSKRKRNEE
eukprot:TRINITY_DN10921_c0_g1_i2.p1 TRINITY_DN10921_c0_g1~~TRINITY_DN10921_c0_g1_i2.p1  ORF type:complete len:142 (+),score=23.84 TRINITY_DN10921_c0_g1_i2:111-536(+)